MRFKIDTKENYNVIHCEDEILSVHLTDSLTEACNKLLVSDNKNVILNLGKITETETEACKALAFLQQNFYEQNTSFLICEMSKEVEESFDKEELLETMNTTPTESEAVDILQMEIIERELLDSDDIEFESE